MHKGPEMAPGTRRSASVSRGASAPLFIFFNGKLL
ncbi:hypothetical protein CPT_Moabite_083 [Serratia phage Moabite]|uniref:Uncharacterized protein n=1 Tax=Serratia phage Moabite TaxID=2587814 RepID=A0A4Y5TQ53_9CAUD|nr:hypothetical protein HWC48_gp333 [Serratia phage Moabite]QDB71113.1 hypothetical protein CPT_Moabite_083 [Serratia phage Moabite]